tara:strand:+ start:289 stop:468 length:180 start_codon:yes stop_codon:yes gene_type:complete
MKKLTRLNFVKENSEYINHVFKAVMEFIESSNEIIIRSDEESFRIDLINYLYNIYLNGQ